MPYIPPEVIDKVKRIDLLTYLRMCDPNELVHISGNTYATRSHDSLKISNCLWNWFSRGVGGKTALEYLITVKEYSFVDAVQHLANIENIIIPSIIANKKKPIENRLILPEKSTSNDKVITYLKSRGIYEDIINKCIDNDMIYEDTSHNVIFVGYDENNVARYAGARATNNSRFMHDITGSNKSYSFMLESKNKTNKIHIFEGAIDLLSFASLLHLKGMNYEDYTLISLAGVYQPAKIIEQSKIPKTIERHLLKNENINELVLHFDNDLAGRNAVYAFQQVIPKRYKITDAPSPIGKDINDYLCSYLGIRKTNKERVR